MQRILKIFYLKIHYKIMLKYNIIFMENKIKNQ
jgi:hypothetical protein